MWYEYGMGRGGEMLKVGGEVMKRNEFVGEGKLICERVGGSLGRWFGDYERIGEKGVKGKGNEFSDIVEKGLSDGGVRE